MNEDITDLNEQEDTQKGRYLTFQIGNETYGLGISFVKEIIGMHPITEVPEIPEYLKGIINLRGKIIPVMDVRLRFRKQPIDYNDRTCIIVVDINGVPVGLIVDKVEEVISIPDEDIAIPPEVSTYTNRYIKGIGKVGNEVKLLLECDRLLNDQDMNDLSNII
nr:chemotaxis protein CheW [Mobilitalea sibirica]